MSLAALPDQSQAASCNFDSSLFGGKRIWEVNIKFCSCHSSIYNPTRALLGYLCSPAAAFNRSKARQGMKRAMSHPWEKKSTWIVVNTTALVNTYLSRDSHLTSRYPRWNLRSGWRKCSDSKSKQCMMFKIEGNFVRCSSYLCFFVYFPS